MKKNCIEGLFVSWGSVIVLAANTHQENIIYISRTPYVEFTYSTENLTSLLNLSDTLFHDVATLLQLL